MIDFLPYYTLPNTFHPKQPELPKGYLGIKALFGLFSMFFFHHNVCHVGFCCLRVDEQLHTDDTMEDGVQRHNEGMALQ